MSERTGDEARILSVNVGKPRTVEWHGREITSAIWKAPVAGPVAVQGDNLVGDQQADLEVHGGPDKAVYAYATEDYSWWASHHADAANGTGYGPGTFGENLTTEGIDLVELLIGSRWQVGSAVLEVRQPRFPCAKLGMRMGDAAFKGLFDEVGRNGAYFGVLEEGEVVAGDTMKRLHQPDHDVRIIDMIEAIRNRKVASDVLERIVAVPAVPEPHRAAAQRGLDRRS